MSVVIVVQVVDFLINLDDRLWLPILHLVLITVLVDVIIITILISDLKVLNDRRVFIAVASTVAVAVATIIAIRERHGALSSALAATTDANIPMRRSVVMLCTSVWLKRP